MNYTHTHSLLLVGQARIFQNSVSPGNHSRRGPRPRFQKTGTCLSSPSPLCFKQEDPRSTAWASWLKRLLRASNSVFAFGARVWRSPGCQHTGGSPSALLLSLGSRNYMCSPCAQNFHSGLSFGLQERYFDTEVLTTKSGPREQGDGEQLCQVEKQEGWEGAWGLSSSPALP